jgi:hypothetical protein
MGAPADSTSLITYLVSSLAKRMDMPFLSTMGLCFGICSTQSAAAAAAVAAVAAAAAAEAEA